MLAAGGGGETGVGGKILLVQEYEGDKEYQESRDIPRLPRIPRVPEAIRYFLSSQLMLVGFCRSHCIVSVTPDTSSAQAFDCALRKA